MTAKVRLRIGPVSASFTGKVTLSDIDPPNGYRITGEGQGGVAGFAKGGAVVALREDGGDTVLNYDVDAQVGGKIAQVGARLIDGHGASKLADSSSASSPRHVGAPPSAAAVGRSGLGGRDRCRPLRPPSAAAQRGFQALDGHRRRRRRADPGLPCASR